MGHGKLPVFTSKQWFFFRAKNQGKHLEIGSKEVIEYLVADNESSGPEDPEV